MANGVISARTDMNASITFRQNIASKPVIFPTQIYADYAARNCVIFSDTVVPAYLKTQLTIADSISSGGMALSNPD